MILPPFLPTCSLSLLQCKPFVLPQTQRFRVCTVSIAGPVLILNLSYPNRICILCQLQMRTILIPDDPYVFPYASVVVLPQDTVLLPSAGTTIILFYDLLLPPAYTQPSPPLFPHHILTFKYPPNQTHCIHKNPYALGYNTSRIPSTDICKIH